MSGAALIAVLFGSLAFAGLTGLTYYRSWRGGRLLGDAAELRELWHEPAAVGVGGGATKHAVADSAPASSYFSSPSTPVAGVAAVLRINGWPYLRSGFRYCRTNPQIPLQLLGAIAT